MTKTKPKTDYCSASPGALPVNHPRPPKPPMSSDPWDGWGPSRPLIL